MGPNARPIAALIVRFAAVTVILSLCALNARAQASAYKGPRTKDGKPDLNGVWQVMNTANWDLAPHAAQPSHIVSLGAQGAEPGGIGVVEGGEIPYLPAALAKKKENYAKRFTDDPEIKCYMPGVPRATYEPFPFQIVQSDKVVMIAYEFAAANRQIYLGTVPEAGSDSWMGHSVGHWEGDSLVVEVTDMVDQTWLDRAGDFHSDALHVTERYTPASPEVLWYEATIEDPQVYSRPWKISMPIYKHVEKNPRLMEFRCAEFIEELLYGQYKRKSK